MAYTKGQLENIVIGAANKYGVPPQIALAIAQHESGFRPEVNNAGLNKNGSTDWGLMQLNDITLKTYGITREQALDPVVNAEYAMKLLKSNLDRFGGDVDKAIWGYAAGPGNVKGTPPAAITNYQSFVKNYKPSANTGYEAYATVFPSQGGDWEGGGGGGGSALPEPGSEFSVVDGEGWDSSLIFGLDMEDPATMAAIGLLAVGAWLALK